MGYKLYSILVSFFSLFQKARINKVIREKDEIIEINKKLEWDIFKLQTINKNLHYIYILSQNEKDIRNYFLRQKINKVVIYGMNEVGKAAARLLINAGVNVCYGIDRNSNIVCDDLEIRQAENIDDIMDIIIVSAEVYFTEIKENVGNKAVVCKLSELLEEILITSHNY